MSQEITEKSSRRRKTTRRDRKTEARKRTAFLRLYGDIIDELGSAIRRRSDEGMSHADIANAAGIDPAVLSRVLSGRAGNNIRTVAAVLYGTEHRMKIEAVPCENLNLWNSDQTVRKHRVIHVLDLDEEGGKWVLSPSKGKHSQEAGMSIWKSIPELEDASFDSMATAKLVSLPSLASAK